MPRRRVLPCALSLLLVSAGALVACGGTDEVPEPGASPPGEITYELFDFVHELDAESIEALEPWALLPVDDVLRFQGKPALIASLKVHDVLVSRDLVKTPHGLLHQVLEVREENGKTLVTVKPVPMQLAFKKLHARVPLSAVDLGALAPTAGGVSPQARYSTGKTLGGTTILDQQIFDSDNNRETKSNQLYVTGEATGKVSYEVFFDTDWAEDAGRVLEELACAGTAGLLCKPDLPNLKIGASASMRAAIKIDVEGASKDAFDTQPIPIEGTNVALPTIFIGPVPVTANLEFTARVAGSANGRFHATAGLGFGMDTSIAFGLTSGLEFQKPTATHELVPPTFETSFGAEIKATVGPQLKLRVAGIAGPDIGVGVFGKAVSDKAKDPCWSFALGAEASVGFVVEVPYALVSDALAEFADEFGLPKELYRLKSTPTELFQLPNIAQGACGQVEGNVYPPGKGPTDQAYLDAAFTPWSKRIELSEDFTFPHSSDPGLHALTAERTQDAAWLVSGLGLEGPLKIDEDGTIAWAKRLLLQAGADQELDERPVATVAVQSKDTDTWLATSRFTVAKLDPSGELVWARRYLPTDATLASLPTSLQPTGVVEVADGSAWILYSLREIPKDGPAVLLHVTAAGRLLEAKTFAYETSSTVASVLAPFQDGMVVAGNSWQPGDFVGHVARLAADGKTAWAKRLQIACDTSVANSVHPTRVIPLASGSIGLLGKYVGAPARSFFAEITPDGAGATMHTFWTGSTVVDFETNAVAELPVTGFLVAGSRIGVSDDLSSLLTSFDSVGSPQWQRDWQLHEGESTWATAMGALRLTNDGGALTFASVSSADITRRGLWISKVPAKSGLAPFEPNEVRVEADGLPVREPCTMTLVDDGVAPTPLPMSDLGVDSRVKVYDANFSEESLLTP